MQGLQHLGPCLEALANICLCTDRQRYDHHQRGFTENFGHGEVPVSPLCAVSFDMIYQTSPFRNVRPCPAMLITPVVTGFTTKLSSAGLVYKHYGRQIIAQMMGKAEEDPAVEAVYLRVYKNFMEAIDGIDNGMLLTDCCTLWSNIC